MKTEYRGCTIEVTDQFLFRVAELGDKHFQSLQEAREAIDQMVRKAEVATRRKIALPVIHEVTGDHHIVTGIHVKEGHILGVPGARDTYSKPDLFPDVAWIGELIQERNRLQARAKQISETIQPYVIRGNRGLNLQRPEVYENALNTLEREHKEKTAKALAANNTNTDAGARPLNLYYVTHTDQHGERHQIGDAIGAKTPEDALYTILEQSGTEDDGRYEVFWLTQAVA